jgi:hypothetical protein
MLKDMKTMKRKGIIRVRSIPFVAFFPRLSNKIKSDSELTCFGTSN